MHIKIHSLPDMRIRYYTLTANSNKIHANFTTINMLKGNRIHKNYMMKNIYVMKKISVSDN